MTKHDAFKRIDQGLTFGDLRDCLGVAVEFADHEPSTLNRSITQGQALLIFLDAIKGRADSEVIRGDGDALLASNILREFGDQWELAGLAQISGRESRP